VTWRVVIYDCFLDGDGITSRNTKSELRGEKLLCEVSGIDLGKVPASIEWRDLWWPKKSLWLALRTPLDPQGSKNCRGKWSE
jgi:hypothetical protein